MEQTYETCKFGPGDKCDRQQCPFHPEHYMPFELEPKDNEPETKEKK